MKIINVDVKPCMLHVVIFPDAMNAPLSVGTIQVDRKWSHPRNRFATVMRVITFVINGNVLWPLKIFKPISLRIITDPIIDNTPPTLGRMANATRRCGCSSSIFLNEADFWTVPFTEAVLFFCMNKRQSRFRNDGGYDIGRLCWGQKGTLLKDVSQ